MKKKKDPAKVCGDCIHFYACRAQNCGNMARTDATCCGNYETVYDFLDRVKPLWDKEDHP